MSEQLLREILLQILKNQHLCMHLVWEDFPKATKEQMDTTRKLIERLERYDVQEGK